MRIFLVPLSRRAHALHCHSTLAKPSSSYLNRVTVFASKKWEELSQAKPDSMKRKLYSVGTTMLEKIEHRETFFKEVPAKEDITITTMVRFLSFIFLCAILKLAASVSIFFLPRRQRYCES
jgi:hypothetical protein